MSNETLVEQTVTGSERHGDVPLSRIAQRLAHKLRNPLSVITTAASQLEATPGQPISEDDIAFITAIVSAADSLDTTIHRFLQYASPPAIRPQELDAADLCRTAAADGQARADTRPRPITVTSRPGIRGLGLTADAFMLRSILDYLIDNALDSLFAGGEVEIFAEGDSSSVRLTVSDTGEGMDGKIKDRVCQPFVTTRPGRAGLGLSIVAAFAAAHGGHLELKAGDMAGTRAIVTIPRKGNRKDAY